MFEARLNNATTLKKILDAIKDLLNEGTFDCSDSGLQVDAQRIYQIVCVLLMFIFKYYIAVASYG